MEYNIISFGISSKKDIDFLIKQRDLFKKYCLDDFKFTVMVCREQRKLNNEYDELIKKLNELNIFDYVYIPECLKDNTMIQNDMSVFVGYALNESIKTLNKGKLFFVHLDLFAINTFSLKKIFKNCKIGGTEQVRNHVNYLWDNLLYIDTNQADINKISFKCGIVENVTCDTGGESFYYLKTLKDEEIKFIGKSSIVKSNFTCESIKILNNENIIYELNINEKNKEHLLTNYQIQKTELKPHWSEIHIDTFFHYRSFSGWHQNKSNIEIEDINNKRKEIILNIN